MLLRSGRDSNYASRRLVTRFFEGVTPNSTPEQEQVANLNLFELVNIFLYLK
jgi:hypothetical protein